MKKSIYNLTFTQLMDFMLEHGEQKFRALQVWDWLYKKRITSFDSMKNVSKKCRELLSSHFVLSSMDEEFKQEYEDETIKFLFKLRDGNLTETVLMHHLYGFSVCVTTQVGCNIGCTFCASGILSKNRDRTTGEIVVQIMQVHMHLVSREKG